VSGGRNVTDLRGLVNIPLPLGCSYPPRFTRAVPSLGGLGLGRGDARVAVTDLAEGLLGDGAPEGEGQGQGQGWRDAGTIGSYLVRRRPRYAPLRYGPPTIEELRLAWRRRCVDCNQTVLMRYYQAKYFERQALQVERENAEALEYLEARNERKEFSDNE
jgi:hypothetical protein